LRTTRLRQQLGVGLREQLGAILVRRGRISRESLEEALASIQPEERLGEALIRLGLIYEEDLATALAEQFGLKYLRLDTRSLEPVPVSLLPEATARELEAVPLRVTDDRIRIAVADPTNIVAADSLKMALDMDVELAVAERSAVHAAIDEVYAQVGAPEAAVASSQSPRLEVVAIDAADGVAPAVEAVNAALRRGIDLRASDIHFTPQRNGLVVRARVDGVLRGLQTVPGDLQDAVTARLKVMGQLDIAERRLPQDGRVSMTFAETELDLRIAVLPTGWGEEVALRVHYQAEAGPRTLLELGMDDGTRRIFEWALRQPSGGVVVCGPTGSGKTTTLYAALALLHDGARSIISIEDPVEAPIEGVVQVPVNARIGLTFARGLRTILRADPDVILIGEIRDQETADIAMQAALTGHLVLSTLHAENAAAAMTRLAGMGVQPDMLESALRCVASQRLLRRRCSGCARRVKAAPQTAPAGCARCGWTGYAGRIGLYEAVAVGARATGEGVVTATSLEENARALVEQGITTHAECERVYGATLSASSLG
jgi:type IV pilus assembly protein PilB